MVKSSNRNPYGDSCVIEWKAPLLFAILFLTNFIPYLVLRYILFGNARLSSRKAWLTLELFALVWLFYIGTVCIILVVIIELV